jgi:hypothetical protein
VQQSSQDHRHRSYITPLGLSHKAYRMIVRHSPIPELFRSLTRPVRCTRRRYSTRPPPLKLDLLQPHPLIRRIDPGQDVASSSKAVSDIKPEDFVYYPNFFSLEEQAILIKLALWKLDRVDSKKRRTRRRRSSSSNSSQVVEGDAGKTGSQAGTSNSDLQALFEDPSVYGFEEVSLNPTSLYSSNPS